MSEPKEPDALQEGQSSCAPDDTQENSNLQGNGEATQAEAPLKDEKIQLQEQVADYRDKYLRGLADSENLRKRLQKERQELVQYAVQGAIIDFLAPIDHLENALKFADQASPEVKHWAVGFQMILGQFKDALTNNGVIRFDSVGEQFDPHFHEAVEMVTTQEYPSGTVIEESQCGYKMGDKTLRPARVKVAKNAPVEESNESSTEANEMENL